MPCSAKKVMFEGCSVHWQGCWLRSASASAFRWVCNSLIWPATTANRLRWAQFWLLRAAFQVLRWLLPAGLASLIPSSESPLRYCCCFAARMCSCQSSALSSQRECRSTLSFDFGWCFICASSTVAQCTVSKWAHRSSGLCRFSFVPGYAVLRQVFHCLDTLLLVSLQFALFPSTCSSGCLQSSRVWSTGSSVYWHLSPNSVSLGSSFLVSHWCLS